MEFLDFNDLENWLNNLGMFHMRLGLDRMRRAISSLDLAKPTFRIIQVLGTNGKGSTCAFLASLAQNQGVKAGVYTSPHFVSPKERALVDGKQLSDRRWLSAANDIFTALGPNPDLTYFEFLTIIALLIFRGENVDVAIMEAGLGGQNDATTAVMPDAQCFTPIAMDHAGIIGPTLENIALDKARAMNEGIPVFSAPQYPVAKSILVNEARTKHAYLEFSQPLDDLQESRLVGSHQFVNAAVALAAWRRLYGKANKKHLANAFIPGRLQSVPATYSHGPLILDGAHNPHGLAHLARAVHGKSYGEIAAIIFSCLGDKDWKSGLAILLRALRDIPVIIPQLDNSRAAKASLVADYCDKIQPGRAVAAGSLETALAMTQESAGPTLATGSLYLLGEFFNLYPEYLEA